MALPAVVDLEAYRGDTWAQTFRFSVGGAPVDLTGAVVAAACRPAGGGNVPLPVSIPDPLSGEVTIGTPVGGWQTCGYTYDLEVTDNGSVRTWVRGAIAVSADITNAQPA